MILDCDFYWLEKGDQSPSARAGRGGEPASLQNLFFGKKSGLGCLTPSQMCGFLATPSSTWDLWTQIPSQLPQEMEWLDAGRQLHKNTGGNRKAWPCSDTVQTRQYHHTEYKMLCPLPSILQDFSTDNKGKGMTGDILSGQILWETGVICPVILFCYQEYLIILLKRAPHKSIFLSSMEDFFFEKTWNLLCDWFLLW